MARGPSDRTCREPTLAEQLINNKPITEVGSGLEKLEVTLILAPYRTQGKKEGFAMAGGYARDSTEQTDPTQSRCR